MNIIFVYGLLRLLEHRLNARVTFSTTESGLLLTAIYPDGTLKSKILSFETMHAIQATFEQSEKIDYESLIGGLC
jgi:hypothetical protein